MTQAGMTVWQDSVGNICGRYEASRRGAGHAAGVASGYGAQRRALRRHARRADGDRGGGQSASAGARLKKAIEIVGFCDEEGTRFGITLLGSRGLTGTWPESWLAQTDADGVSVAQAMVLAGLDPARIHLAARRPEEIAAYLELHIEQGPCLEQEGLALGVVEAINGARRLNCRFTGEAGHAGTVPMSHRKDALAAAAEWMVRVETLTREQGGNLVATVGTLRCARRG
jgi:allantoate deiminase